MYSQATEVEGIKRSLRCRLSGILSPPWLVSVGSFILTPLPLGARRHRRLYAAAPLGQLHRSPFTRHGGRSHGAAVSCAAFTGSFISSLSRGVLTSALLAMALSQPHILTLTQPSLDLSPRSAHLVPRDERCG